MLATRVSHRPEAKTRVIQEQPVEEITMQEGIARVISATNRQANAVRSGAQPLTDREREILARVAEGLTNKVIGSQLGISTRTVKGHLTSIMTELRATDRTHSVVMAVRLGWLAI